MYAFISYSHKDRKYVEKAITAITAEGFDIWYDKGIKIGDDWADKIGTSLADAAVVILFMSKNSVDNRNVLREVDFAQEHNIPIYTVLINSPKLNEELARKLFVHQAIELFSFKTYNDFARELGGVLASAMDRREAAPVKRMRIKKGGRLKWVLLGLIVVIAAVNIVIKLLFSVVPTVIGLPTQSGKEKIETAGFSCSEAFDYSDEQDYGYLFRQSEFGKTVKSHPVVVTQSLGPADNLTNVPNVIGLHVSDGARLLLEADITRFIIAPAASDDFAESYISGQSIPGGLKVSRNNEFTIDVVTGKDGYSFTFNDQVYSLPTDRKMMIEFLEDGSVKIDPVIVVGMDMTYEERMAINKEETVEATTIVSVDVSREGVDQFGKFRGNLNLEFIIDAARDKSIAWGALKAMAADGDGKINVDIVSEAFTFVLEEYDEEKLEDFVEGITGNAGDVEHFRGPIAMATGNGFIVNEMTNTLNILKYSDILSNVVNFSIPKLNEGFLSQPYYVLLYEDGRASVSFVGSKGEDKIMTFDGMAELEE